MPLPPNDSIAEVSDGEQAHCVYQALSRGSCRVVEYGQAKAMDVYLINSNAKLKPLLERVMQGAVWLKWNELYNLEKNMTKQALLAKKIKCFLNDLPTEVARVTTKQLKQGVLDGVVDSTSVKLFNRSLNLVLSGFFYGWTKDGHSLVRYSKELVY